MPAHGDDILKCLSIYPLEVIAWAIPPLVSIVTLTTLVVRSMWQTKIDNRDSQIANQQKRIDILQTEIETLKATHELKLAEQRMLQTKENEVVELPRQRSQRIGGRALISIVSVALLVGAGGGAFATRLYDAAPLRDAQIQLNQRQNEIQAISKLKPVGDILSDKVLAQIPQHKVVSPGSLDHYPETPVVLFDGSGNTYKFGSLRGKVLHVTVEFVNRPSSKPRASRTDFGSGGPAQTN